MTYLSNLTNAILASAIILLCGLTPVSAHNLDQRDTRLSFDNATLTQISTRAGAGETSIQGGDTVGLILKSTPGPGTLTGAGGCLTFYIPPGTQVLSVEYGYVDATGTFVPTPMKGPAIMPLGDGPIGSRTTTGLIGLNLGPNILG